MTNEIIKVGTFFSGIGSPEKALERYVHPNYENKVIMMNQLKPLCV